MPLYIPIAPSNSVSMMADVPMTMLFSDRSLSWQVSATCAVYLRYSALKSDRFSWKRMSQELTSPVLFFTMVLTAMLSRTDPAILNAVMMFGKCFALASLNLPDIRNQPVFHPCLIFFVTIKSVFQNCFLVSNPLGYHWDISQHY